MDTRRRHVDQGGFGFATALAPYCRVLQNFERPFAPALACFIMAAAGSSRILKFYIELLDAEVATGSSKVPAYIMKEFFGVFSSSNPVPREGFKNTIEVKGCDRWSYSVHLHLELKQNIRRVVDLTFLPHTTVDEVTSNRLVLRNVLMPRINLEDQVDFSIPYLAILFQPCEAADGFTALLRKVCTEVVSLNKLSVIASQVSAGCRRLQSLTVTCAQACSSDVVRYCKDEINADIADAQYCLS